MKKETIEEFLARGGKITKIPEQSVEKGTNVVKPNGTGLPKIMHLTDGEHYFGITRRKKKTLAERIDTFEMDQDILREIKRRLGIESNNNDKIND
jgi:hypothetical protein